MYEIKKQAMLVLISLLNTAMPSLQIKHIGLADRQLNRPVLHV